MFFSLVFIIQLKIITRFISVCTGIRSGTAVEDSHMPESMKHNIKDCSVGLTHSFFRDGPDT